jgi:hypothetical protein
MKIKFLFWLTLVSPWVLLAQSEMTKAQKRQALEELEYLKTRDPETGLVPKERLYEQIEILQEQEQEAELSTAKLNGVGATDKWIELG